MPRDLKAGRIRPSYPPPNPITDKARLEERVAEYVRRLKFVKASYDHLREVENATLSFNDSLALLKASVAHPPSDRHEHLNLHPELPLIVDLLTRRELDLVDGQDLADCPRPVVTSATTKVINELKPLRGRPRDIILRHHVEGLMALIEEMSGVPVISVRDTLSDYDPHFDDPISQSFETIFKGIDPTVTVGRLATIVREARPKFDRERPGFFDYFPTYGVRRLEDGSIVHEGDVRKIATIIPASPIYFPGKP